MNATDVAEQGRDWSTYCVSYGDRWVIACVPNVGGQELVGAFGRAVLARAFAPPSITRAADGAGIEATAASPGPESLEAA